MTLVLAKPQQRAYASLSVLLAGNFVTILDVFIVYVALPSIRRDLDASAAELQMIMVVYSVSYGAMLLNGARIGDFFGRRRLFLIGMGVFALASLLCGLATSPWGLIGSRALQGLGAALLMPQVYSSLGLLFEGDERQRALAIMGAVQGVAGAASQALGGSLLALNVYGLGWRVIFFVNLPVAVYALAFGRGLIVETRDVAPLKLDLIGAVLGASALTMFLLPIMTGGEGHWSWPTIAALLASVPLLAGFIAYEGRVARSGGAPIIDPRLFGSRDFALGILATFLFFSAVSSFSLALTLLLQIGLDQTPLQAAMLFLPSTVAFFAGSLVSAALVRRSRRQAPMLGMAIFLVGLVVAIIEGYAGGRETWALSASVILQGFGQGIVIPLLVNIVLGAVADAQVGMASGAFSTLQTAGSAFGVTIVGAIIFGVLREGGAQVSSSLQDARLYSSAFAAATLYNVAASSVALGLFRALHLRNELRKEHLPS